jgi:acyl-CoA hydrolase
MSGQLSRIVPYLSEGAGVVTSRAQVDYVVTEYSVAFLYDLSLLERREQFIKITHLDFRCELENIARA